MDIEQALYNKQISEESYKNLKKWLSDSNFSEFVEEINKEIQLNNWKDLENAFYTRIAIGTGGIRGPIGYGPNRINNRTIGEAAQGLSQFIYDFGAEAVSGGVVVGYDARKFSKEFAQISAEVFAANGIKVYFFDGLRATPEISFAVRSLNATAGVMITASHNPRTDNGFKFYWSDGGQVVPPNDAKFMQLVTDVTTIKSMDFEKAKADGFIEIIGEKVDRSYFEHLSKLSLSKSRSAKIVFSPMHGSGSTNVLPLLKKEDFNITLVPEQSEPDSNFPTAVGDLINPEFPEVMQMAVQLGESLSADLVLVSDPDADRIGVAALDSKGRMHLFNGDQVGAMLAHYILSKRKEKNNLPEGSVVLETFVTTTLVADIARSFHVKVVEDLLVGFKYIAEIIEQLDNQDKFVFAAEQSLGYLTGSFLRDKDAAMAALSLAELASELKDQNLTLVDYLENLYAEYGFYDNKLYTLDMTGRSGSERLYKIMMGLRNNPPTNLGGMKVLETIDRLSEIDRPQSNYKVGKTGDQISFILSEDKKIRVTVRPSGTEPIAKFYIQNYKIGVKDLTAETAQIQSAILDYVKQFYL